MHSSLEPLDGLNQSVFILNVRPSPKVGPVKAYADKYQTAIIKGLSVVLPHGGYFVGISSIVRKKGKTFAIVEFFEPELVSQRKHRILCRTTRFLRQWTSAVSGQLLQKAEVKSQPTKEINFRPSVVGAGTAGDDIPRQRSAGGRKHQNRTRLCNSVGFKPFVSLLDQESWGFGGEASKNRPLEESFTERPSRLSPFTAPQKGVS